MRGIRPIEETFDQVQKCSCGNVLAGYVDLEQAGAKLDPGDYAICESCGHFLVMGCDGRLSPVADDVVRSDKRFRPASIDQLFEAQKAVRHRARLLVSRDANGERTITMIAPIEGRKVDYGIN